MGFDNTEPYPMFDHSTNILIWDIHPSVAKSFMEDKLGLGLGISIQRADFELRQPVLIPTDYPRPYDFFPVDALMITDGWGGGIQCRDSLQIQSQTAIRAFLPQSGEY